MVRTAADKVMPNNECINPRSLQIRNNMAMKISKRPRKSGNLRIYRSKVNKIPNKVMINKLFSLML